MSERSQNQGSQLSGLSRSSMRSSIWAAELAANGQVSASNFKFYDNFLYPYIAETNRTYLDSLFVNFLVSGLVIFQMFFGCFFDFLHAGGLRGIEICNKIAFCGISGDPDTYVIPYVVIGILDIVLGLIFLGIYGIYRVSFEFNKASMILLKYVYGEFILYFTAIHPCYLLATLSDLAYETTSMHIFYFALALVSNIIYFTMVEFLTIPIMMSPFISQSNIFLWNPRRMMRVLYVYGLGLGTGQYLKRFKQWHRILPHVLLLGGCFLTFTCGWSLQLKDLLFTAMFMAFGVATAAGSIISTFRIWFNLSNWVIYGVPAAIYFCLICVFLPLNIWRKKRIVKNLSYQNFENPEKITEQEKFEYFETLKIRTFNKAFSYLIIGLEEGSPLFLDFSLIKWLLEKFPEDNELLIVMTWFASFFPNEQLVMHNLITRINKMVNPTHLQRIMRFQLHRVHVFRQSSASREANADLARVRTITDALITENTRFWINAARPHNEIKHDFYKRAMQIRQKADASWSEVIDKYPNNARFATEYSRFLIEGVCQFKEGLHWYHKALMIESGKMRESDQLFKTFVRCYQFYLKKGLVGIHGDIKMDRVISRFVKEQNGEESTASASVTSTSKSNASTQNSSNDDSDSTVIDLQEGEKALPRVQLRLAFEQAVRSIKSSAVTKTMVTSGLRLIFSIVYIIIFLVYVLPLFDEDIALTKHLKNLNNFESVSSMIGEQIYWYLASSYKDLNKTRIEEFLGSNMSKLNYYTKPSLDNFNYTISNLTYVANNYLDEFSKGLYLSDIPTQKEQEIAELLTVDTFYEATCTWTKFTPTLEGWLASYTTNTSYTMDSVMRIFMIRSGSISALTQGLSAPDAAKAILDSREFCEMFNYYVFVQDGFDTLAKNISSRYNTISKYIANSTANPYLYTYYNNFKVEYLNEDPLPNATDDENYDDYNEEAEAGEEEEEESDSVSTTTNFFIAFTPFIVLLFTMPTIVYLSAALSSELKAMTNMMLTMPTEACEEASQRIQRSVVGNQSSKKKGVNAAVTSSSTLSVPPYVINICNAIIFIALVIFVSIEAQVLNSKAKNYINQINLYMVMRNSVVSLACSQEFYSLSLMKQKGKLAPGLGAYAPFTQGFFDSTNATATQKGVLTRVHNRITLIRELLDLGSKDYVSALDFSSTIDSARFDPQCTFEPGSQYVLNYYKCLSFDRLLNYYFAIHDEIYYSNQEKASDAPYQFDTEAMYTFGNILNGRLLPEFDKFINTYFDTFDSLISQYKTIVYIVFVVCLLFSIIAFFVEVATVSHIREIYNAYNSIILRLNPIHFVQNQNATAFLINKDQSQNQISSAAHAVFHTSPDAMLLINTDCIIEKLNPAATTIFHFTPEQLLGQNCQMVLPQSPKNQQFYYTLQLMQSGQCGLVFESQLEGVRDDGVKVPLKATLLGFSSNHRNADFFAVMCKDQTEEMRQKEAVEVAKKKSDDLLLKILPPDIIRRINKGEKDITMVVPSASVIFIDICQFSTYMATLSAQQCMSNLNAVFTAYDKILADLPLITKIKLIGDDYMAAAGLFSPDEPPKSHAIQTITFGLRVLDAIEELNEQLNASLMVRIGVNSGGPIIAGVLGTDKPLFDIIGDTINVAARLQSTDIPGNVQISKGTYEIVAGEGKFHIEERGEIYLKGKGNQMTYLVSPAENQFVVN
ncbi:Adenylate and Guanylate cyclase catalytic domain containing protein [Trichomonas vaginalis G3]|uniref:Adenylate and Guanylate cyclase catalytic domain containing protein n=1 Tax=Trichomonas vaginalis (strain ATCC PRA-98 / G3) TaxID=412133 RepID=A2DFE4_TRIV3|nr:adenylate cyclase protein [Trichomonas vaginalis G3]EAY20872.1 Adenylate and Guanylate cyclase catalytic domain containing protein [Trichomonas vaginalis G3]KAI5521518.1 adenylate cyclase protein [Trichomonas vaginalis G3]|eukprot:XP_001581858.1 Adenylate and Guanylate cyclase catalytic domain containing protein [Trichomonas vaginalis G3]